MAKIIEVKPHGEEPKDINGRHYTVFLAGTIDMGNSIDWQKEFIERAKGWSEDTTYVVYNPRREQGFGDNQEEFKYQVNWELEHLESCDFIVMCILGTSKSPISLMELGLFARSEKLEVICEPNFYRYGNVKITCEKYNVPLYESLDKYLNAIK